MRVTNGSGPRRTHGLFQIAQPAATHFRRVTCRQAECRAYCFGFTTIVPVGGPQDRYIRHHSGKAFTDKVDGGMVEFFIKPGQEFWDGSPAHQHKIPIGRDPLFIHRPSVGVGARRLGFPEFADTMNEHMYESNQQRQRG